MTKNEVDTLLSVGIATARVLGFGIAEGCQQHLQEHLAQAAWDVPPIAAAEPPLVRAFTRDELMLLAQARVAEFTAAMAADAIKNGIPADRLLHENNFFDVKAWICPMWPVCP
jgi:hypothetical protein